MECTNALQKAGFYVKHQKGSHIILRRDTPFAQAVVPKHKEIAPGTVRAILKQIGLTAEEFVELLRN
jgi:predicted RNA binding protein YcfA (HicA-like mRNA interferase family)